VLPAPCGDRYMPDTSLLCSASRRAQIVSRSTAPITRTGSVRSTPSTKTLVLRAPEAQPPAEVNRKDAAPAAQVLQRVKLVRVAYRVLVLAEVRPPRSVRDARGCHIRRVVHMVLAGPGHYGP
jgi:hypothetical protein